MKRYCQSERRKQEAGSALLIAIFALLLISVVGLALLVSTGSDSALAGNYRTSTASYYAAVAGLEEGRGRMLWRNPDFIDNTLPNFVPILPNATMPLNQVLYILNPANGETVDPKDTSNPLAYPDMEYQSEFGIAPGAASWQYINSVWQTPGPLPGPSYKWVRITPTTEKSLGVDVDQNGFIDPVNLVYYDPANVTPLGVFKPGLIVGSPQGTARQAFQITAFAVLPNDTRKLLQYVVTPLSYGMYFHSALEIPGANVAFQVPTVDPFYVSGIDGTHGGMPATPVPGCTPSGGSFFAIGMTEPDGTATNLNTVRDAIPAAQNGNYTGSPNPNPPPNNTAFSMTDSLYMNAAMSSPTAMNNMIQSIAANADYTINKAFATQADMPSAMSATNPVTVVATGNLSLGGFTGYGLLVVEGNFAFTPDSGWRGVVMVVGTGQVSYLAGSLGGGANEFDGAFFVAQITDPNGTPGNILANFGTPTFDASAANGNGIYYNSCWIAAAQRPPTYRILSFREITQ